MIQSYINYINHNRYLKINYKNFYNYDNLNEIKINIKFKKEFNNKFLILCIFFLFKNIILKNGYFIILNKHSKKIIGLKFSLKKNLMFNFLNFIISNFLNQPEIQNNIKLISFDSSNNYMMSLSDTSYYYLEKLIHNNNFKKVLNCFNIYISFNFKNKKNDLFDHIFYLNLFKFYFYDIK